MAWFRFMDENVSNIYFVLYALFNLEQGKRSECRSDVCVLWSAGDDMS